MWLADITKWCGWLCSAAELASPPSAHSRAGARGQGTGSDFWEKSEFVLQKEPLRVGVREMFLGVRMEE